MPASRTSLETLYYIGLTDALAAETWDSWQRLPLDETISLEVESGSGSYDIGFIEFILRYAEDPLDDVWGEDDALWYAHMDRGDLTMAAQLSVMIPGGRDARLTKSSWYWVKDMLECDYLWLEFVESRTVGRETLLARRSLQHYQQGLEQGTTLETRRGHVRGRSLNSTATDTEPRQRFTRTPVPPTRPSRTAVQHTHGITKPEDIPGTINLYKGVDQARVIGLTNHSGDMSYLSQLCSDPPTDFTPNMYQYG